MNKPVTHCGYVAIVGRPNVGKSTLLNHLLGQKISITSRKPQTTRYRILGVKTVEPNQIIYVDTPGIQATPHRAMDRIMNRMVGSVFCGIDIIAFVVEPYWNDKDQVVFDQLKKSNA